MGPRAPSPSPSPSPKSADPRVRRVGRPWETDGGKRCSGKLRNQYRGPGAGVTRRANSSGGVLESVQLSFKMAWRDGEAPREHFKRSREVSNDAFGVRNWSEEVPRGLQRRFRSSKLAPKPTSEPFAEHPTTLFDGNVSLGSAAVGAALSNVYFRVGPAPQPPSPPNVYFRVQMQRCVFVGRIMGSSFLGFKCVDVCQNWIRAR